MVISDILYHAIRNKGSKVEQIFKPYIDLSERLLRTAMKYNRLHIIERNFKLHFSKYNTEWRVNDDWKQVINKLT